MIFADLSGQFASSRMDRPAASRKAFKCLPLAASLFAIILPA
jgi:hypothetical protein